MDALHQVLTIPEIAQGWYLHPDTVRKALVTRRNPLVARKSGRVWLVSYESVVKRWGEPRNLSLN